MNRITATVGAIEVIRHSCGPCRHCGQPFEQTGGKHGCGCSGLTHCPACGCPVQDPVNNGADAASEVVAVPSPPLRPLTDETTEKE